MGEIEFRNVTKRFQGGALGLRGVSLVIPAGSMAFITGHSGAGKSTFLKLLLRMQAPTRGQILVDGYDIGAIPRRQLPAYRRGLGAVFQDHHLLRDRSGFENVALPLRVAGMTARDIGRRVRAALTGVELLESANAFPDALSTGEQQRLGIARAVVNRPQILLADEPTGNLDPVLSSTIMGYFRQFNAVGTTVLVASHDTALIASMGVRTIELADGAVVADSELKERARG